MSTPPEMPSLRAHRGCLLSRLWKPCARHSRLKVTRRRHVEGRKPTKTDSGAVWCPLFLAAIMVTAKGAVALSSMVGAYSRACMGAYLMSADDAMNPDLAHLRGDGGKELLRDMRAIGIGKTAQWHGGTRCKAQKRT